jgi:hypothetical protein
MALFEESDEQKSQQWQSRVAQKRLDLSASVEETLGDSSSLEDEEWSEEDENPRQVSSSQGTALIPPRLSLQSKPLPIVRSQAAVEPIAPTGRTVESGNIIARVAHRITSRLSSFERGPRNDGSTAALPMVPGGYKERKEYPQVRAGTIPAARPVEVSEQTGEQRNGAKRTTKVRLQVVPKTDPTPGTRESASPLCDVATNPTLPAMSQTGGRIETPPSPPPTPSPLSTPYEYRQNRSGSGTFEAGQSDVAVAHTDITSTSVVVVMLTGDPGPVVVQYISLRPTIGFTVHLSAPTKNVTPFNYTIL